MKKQYILSRCNIAINRALDILQLMGFKSTHCAISAVSTDETQINQQIHQYHLETDKYVNDVSMVWGNNKIDYIGYDDNNTKKTITFEQNNDLSANIIIITNVENMKYRWYPLKSGWHYCFRLLYEHDYLYDGEQFFSHYQRWLKAFNK